MCKTVEKHKFKLHGLEHPMIIGAFYNVELKGNNIIVTDSKGNDIGIVQAGDAKCAFYRRNHLKGVVVDYEDGVATFQIIHWADLHRHSGRSFLDGGSRIEDIVNKTEYAGALTDHGGMYGVLTYYKLMKQQGKLPILGFEAYVETIDGKKEGNHLLLLAKDIVGFKNLIKLTSLSQENFYRKPHVSYDMLANHSEGIITTTSCMSSEISQLILNGKYEDAKYVARAYIDMFGKDDYYVEMQRHGFHEEMILNKGLKELARELELKIIATTDSHYTNPEDREAQEVLMCIGTKKTMDDENRMKFSGDGYHIHTHEEIEDLFFDMPEALDNTLEIAEKCSGLELELNVPKMPHFDVPEGHTENSFFKEVCWKGFETRFKGTPKFDSDEYRERLSYEISIIEKMGFEGYFLIVWDFVNFAKRNYHLATEEMANVWKSFIEQNGHDPSPILVGPGRGSAVGSLIAYCLQIVDLDPIEYDLLFERFLNPDRVSMPDIDIDFQDDRRDEVINYVKYKYGEESVSRIITFGTLSAKAVVRDVARALGHEPAMGDRISKVIPKGKTTLKKALEESPEFKKMYDTEPSVKKIIDVAMKLEGLERNPSVHACGLVVAPSAVSDYLPEVIMEDKETGIKERTSQFTMAEVEEMGLLKMDFLGLRTMTVIAKTIRMVNEKRKKEGLPPIKYLDIPLNDKRVYQEIAKGQSYGVFQLESAGMRSFMTELYSNVDELEDGSKEFFDRLIAGISLYRPGPLDYIPEYIKNMRSPEYITYDHPDLEPILKSTYGVIVYQEQTMAIVRKLANFTKGEADNVRKAFAKKKEEMIAPLGEKFLKGCLENGIDKEVAERIWNKMKEFGKYAFNKSHATAYAMLGAITGWLKTYYPVEFMCALLNSFIDKNNELKMYLSVTAKMGIKLLPPDVNKSEQYFSIDNGQIRFGFMGLKGISKASVDIIKERELNGEYKGLQDFGERLNSKIGKSVIQALIYAGAFDEFEGTRRAKIIALDELAKHLDKLKKGESKNVPDGQISLFDIAEESGFDDFSKERLNKVIKIPDVPEMDKSIKLEKEKEYVGHYITEHPIDEYEKYFRQEGVYEIAFLNNSNEESEEEEAVSYSYDGETVKIAGIVKDIKIYYTKKDQKPLYVFQLEDRTDEMKAVVFSDRIEMNEDKLIEGKIVIAQGKIKVDDFGTQIIINNMIDIEQIAKSEKPKSVWVRTDNHEKAQEFFYFVEENQGNVPAFLYYKGKAYRAKYDVSLNYHTFAKLQEMYGVNFKVVYE